jgi:hypothetical protein
MYRDLESELKNGESRAQAPITVLHTRTVVALPRFCLWEDTKDIRRCVP